MELKMSEITDRICRACLEPSTKTYPLVGSVLNVNVNIASMLEYCTSKKLDLSDNLPQDVCLSCFKIIRLAYNFLKQFQESQEKLYESCKNQQDEHEDKCDETTVNSDSQYDLWNIHNYSVKGENQTTQHAYNIEDPVGIEKTEREDLSEEGYHEMCESNEIKYVKIEDSSQSNDEKLISEIDYLESFDPEIFEFKYVEDDSDMPVKVESTNSINNDLDMLQASEISSEKKSKSAKKKVFRLGKDPFGSVVYKCPICPEESYHYRAFHRHVLSHNMETIVCTRCMPKVELSVDEFFPHYKEVHKYQCGICHKCLSSSYGYQYHMKHHEDIKKHKCPFEGCEKSYFFNALLKNHLRLHTKPTVHPCDLCNANFNSVVALRYHKKTHEGDRNHLCVHCGKAFYQAVHLKDHINRHMGHKAFTCHICGKSFITNSQLSKHIKLCTKKNRKIKAN